MLLRQADETLIAAPIDEHRVDREGRRVGLTEDGRGRPGERNAEDQAPGGQIERVFVARERAREPDEGRGCTSVDLVDGCGERLRSGQAFVMRADIAWSPDARPIGGYFARRGLLAKCATSNRCPSLRRFGALEAEAKVPSIDIRRGRASV